MTDSDDATDESPPTGPTRRAVLGATGTAAIAALAGCDHDDPVNPSPSGPTPDLTLKDVRVVQKVEDSALTNASGSLPDPPVVAGENATVLFDVDITDPGNLPETVGLVVSSTPDNTEMPVVANLHRDDLRAIDDGADAAAVFHERARAGGTADSLPVFEVGGNISSLEVELTNAGVSGDSVTLRAGPNADFELATLSNPLRVGFIHVEDPGATNSPRFTRQEVQGNDRTYTTDVDWGDANGEARNYDRSVRSSFEYLRRSYPGDVVAYKHPKSKPLVGVIPENFDPESADDDSVRDEWDWGAGVDGWRARDVLNKIRGRGSFPVSGSEILTSGGISRQQAINTMDADKGGKFDVRVMICPRGTASGNTNYFAAHDMGAVGYHWGTKMAVGSLEAEQANSGPSDLGHATTTAQEIGHRFAWAIYSGGYRRNNSDTTHANASLKSVGYDLTGGTFTLVTDPDVQDGSFSVGGPATSGGKRVRSKYPSYMSYAGGDEWADSKVHRSLVSDDFDRNPSIRASGGAMGDGLSGASQERGTVQPVLELFGILDDDRIRFEELTVRDDVPQDADGGDLEERGADEAEPVDVAVRGPGGERLAGATVPDRLQGTHGDRPHGYVTASLPFPMLGVALAVERGDVSTRLNAVTRPVRDAVGRVPEEGLRGEETRARLAGALDEVEAAMAEGQYAAAATMLDEEVGGLLSDAVADYEGSAGDPTREDLLGLVGRLTDRLQFVAEETG